jgi:hypothetical protein
MRRRHHGAQRRFDRPAWIRRKIGDARERLVGLGVEDVEDCPDQKRMARLLPVVAPLECALRIDQDVRDVLNVADLPFATPDLEQGL